MFFDDTVAIVELEIGLVKVKAGLPSGSERFADPGGYVGRFDLLLCDYIIGGFFLDDAVGAGNFPDLLGVGIERFKGKFGMLSEDVLFFALVFNCGHLRAPVKLLCCLLII